jgi:aspartate/methionine/tyrosine aminotransferase
VPSPFPLHPRPEIDALMSSQIREVANAGIGRSDILPFWFGEPDQVTPEFIRAAAVRALTMGATFYTANLGLTELRETIAHYVSGLHGPVDVARVAVTGSGMSALMLIAQALVSPGDRVVAITPVWPNAVEAPKIMGAQVVRVPLQCEAGVWSLDIDRLLDAITPQTRAVIVNSPNNPTGWVMRSEDQIALLEHCRKRGAWIIADDVYERLIFADALRCAPSFLDVADEQDRLLSANSFSKAWMMTGWRLGWLVSPRSREGDTLLGAFGKLIEYNTSCAPGFVQEAAIEAIRHGEPGIERLVSRVRVARDYLCARLRDMPGVSVAPPQGAMYVFFRLQAGETNTVTLAKRLVAEAALGLAPGSAFGPEGEGCMRWCVASSVERLEEGANRLERYMQRAENR